MRDEAGHKIAPEMVTKLKIVLRTRLSTSNIFYFMSGTIVLVAVIYLTILPVLQDLEFVKTLGGTDKLGDSFGIISSIFSGLAFAGLIWAILLQRQDLTLQRYELKLTREELSGQKQALMNQNDNMQRSNSHKVLSDLLLEYRSPAMFSAIRIVWQFYRENKANFVEVYLKQWKKDKRILEKLSGDKVSVYEQQTLHYKRRLVVSFYVLAAGLVSIDVISKEDFHIYWGEEDLDILKKIAIPIDLAFAMDELGLSESEVCSNKTTNLLLQLFDEEMHIPNIIARMKSENLI